MFQQKGLRNRGYDAVIKAGQQSDKQTEMKPKACCPGLGPEQTSGTPHTAGGDRSKQDGPGNMHCATSGTEALVGDLTARPAPVIAVNAQFPSWVPRAPQTHRAWVPHLQDSRLCSLPAASGGSSDLNVELTRQAHAPSPSALRFS